MAVKALIVFCTIVLMSIVVIGVQQATFFAIGPAIEYRDGLTRIVAVATWDWGASAVSAVALCLVIGAVTLVKNKVAQVVTLFAASGFAIVGVVAVVRTTFETSGLFGLPMPRVMEARLVQFPTKDWHQSAWMRQLVLDPTFAVAMISAMVVCCLCVVAILLVVRGREPSAADR